MEDDGGARNDIVVYVDYGADDNPWLRPRRVRQQSQLLLSRGIP
jgi:hypothetical protein